MIRLSSHYQIFDMKVLIVDFKDSFTHNLSGLCQQWSIEHEVVDFTKVDRSFVSNFRPKSIIWGPGPGHPDEYSEIVSLISEILEEKSIFQIGVCLGHQLILKSLGYSIIDNEQKLHGQSLGFVIPSWEDFPMEEWGKTHQVQYYSSLGVQSKGESENMVVENGLILSSKGDNYLSFQFHPESVGTSCPELFFHRWRSLLIQ